MDCENCTWSKANHSRPIAKDLTCGAFAARQRNVRGSVDPDRCEGCNEVFTPRITKGAIKCKCDVPKPPRWVLEQWASDDRPSPAINRGR